MDPRAAYAGVRERVIELVRGLDEAAAATVAPATPAWTVKDLCAHLAGVLADIRDGNLDGVGTEPWTATQVETRRGKSLGDVLDEWEANAKEVEPMIDELPPRGCAQLVSDAWTHEQDIRGALRMPGGRDTDAARTALDAFVSGLIRRAMKAGLALRVRSDGREWTTDEVEGAATLTADPFELTRALSGRRNAAQVRAFDWDGDPGPYLEVFGQFPLRDEPLVEDGR